MFEQHSRAIRRASAGTSSFFRMRFAAAARAFGLRVAWADVFLSRPRSHRLDSLMNASRSSTLVSGTAYGSVLGAGDFCDRSAHHLEHSGRLNCGENGVSEEFTAAIPIRSDSGSRADLGTNACHGSSRLPRGSENLLAFSFETKVTRLRHRRLQSPPVRRIAAVSGNTLLEVHIVP